MFSKSNPKYSPIDKNHHAERESAPPVILFRICCSLAATILPPHLPSEIITLERLITHCISSKSAFSTVYRFVIFVGVVNLSQTHRVSPSGSSASASSADNRESVVGPGGDHYFLLPSNIAARSTSPVKAIYNQASII